MSNYLLLRDDQQIGPYTFEQLKAIGLEPTDLVWVQGRSDGWTSAVDVEELKELIRMPGKTGQANALPGFQNSGLAFERFTSNESPGLETKYSRPLEEIKEMYVQHLQKTGKTKWYKAALAAEIVAVMVLGGLVVKYSMDKPEEVQIKEAGAAVVPPSGEAVTNSQNFQNALSKEFIPYEAKPKKIKPKDLKKLVSVQVNNYEVKLLGGIKNLDVTVQNFSEHLLDEVTIKIDYLKPKGEVINSEVVTINNIKSGEAKTIEVPPSSRGVKVKYSIVDVHSQEYKAIAEQL
jgi:hypothetical protein